MGVVVVAGGWRSSCEGWGVVGLGWYVVVGWTPGGGWQCCLVVVVVVAAAVIV